jgi:alpha-galactosidase
MLHLYPLLPNRRQILLNCEAESRNNIGPSFTDLRRIINALVPISLLASPGGWNDLDLLQVGNEGMTVAEWKTQFAFWAAAKQVILLNCVA